MKKIIIGVCLLVICIGLTVYSEIKQNTNYQTNIHDITNSGSSTENVKVYLNATLIAGTLKDDYYVVFGDEVQYIVHMDSKLASSINKYLLDHPDDSYQITGVTKIIPNDFESLGMKFIENWLDLNHDHSHSHEITKDEFYHYFGHVYLDSMISDNIVIKIAIYVTGTIGILLIFSEVLKKYKLL